MPKAVLQADRFNINLTVLAEHRRGLAVQAVIGPPGGPNVRAPIIARPENAGQAQRVRPNRPRRVHALTAPVQEPGLAPTARAGAIPTGHASAIKAIR